MTDGDSNIAADALDDDRFPSSSKCDANWLADGCYGANPLWRAERGHAMQNSRRNVTLRPIDAENRASCLALSVSEEQTGLIASNAKSLEWVDRNPKCVPVGIYVDDEMVGFAMYEPRGNDVFSVHRFMVDQRHQRKGIGLQAMWLVMEQIVSLGA